MQAWADITDDGELILDWDNVVFYSNKFDRGFHMWMNVATSNGITHASIARDAVERKMTSEQISRAHQLAGECIEKKFKNCD